MLFHAHATLKQLRTHLRKFTMLWTPSDDQAPVYFRFYDPRVVLDMTQALEPWKLATFMAPMEALILPVSPLMAFPVELTLTPPVELDTPANEVQGRLVQVALSRQARSPSRQGRQFAISQQEFDHFNNLTSSRAKLNMANELRALFPEHIAKQRLEAVDSASHLGSQYGLKSKKQIRTLAKCVLVLGDDFLDHYPEVSTVLFNAGMLAWQKRQFIENWLPRVQARSDFNKRITDSRDRQITWRKEDMLQGQTDDV